MITVAGTRTIKLYPGSDPNLTAVDPGFVLDDRARELWIDCNIDVDINHLAFDLIETVVFYDFFWCNFALQLLESGNFLRRYYLKDLK